LSLFLQVFLKFIFSLYSKVFIILHLTYLLLFFFHTFIFLVFFLHFCFWKKKYSLLEIFIILHLTYLYHYFCSYLYSFVSHFLIFSWNIFFWKIIKQRLRKLCVNKAIIILSHSYNKLNMSLRFYKSLLTHIIFTIFYYM
jgi:hypothetical protein